MPAKRPHRNHFSITEAGNIIEQKKQSLKMAKQALEVAQAAQERLNLLMSDLA